MQNKKPLILDLHVPYGITPLNYVGGEQLCGSNEEKNAYLNAMIEEVRTYEGQLDDYEIQAIRLSGGAASVMKPDLLGELINVCRKTLPVAHGAEVSFDALPNTICTPSLTGIGLGRPNRVELMMRSYLDEELTALQAPFRVEDIRNALLYFGRFHVNNIGFTINYGIPGQTRKSFEYTVKSCANMAPRHISVLPLAVTVSEGMASAEERLAMFKSAHTILTDAGYRHYGAGLFCMPGSENAFECLRGEGCEVAGIGLNAHSMYDGVKTRNTNNVHLYILNAAEPDKLIAGAAAISDEELWRNYVYARLSMCDGFSAAEFEYKFGAKLSTELENELKELCSKGLLTIENGVYIPTLEYLFNSLEQ